MIQRYFHLWQFLRLRLLYQDWVSYVLIYQYQSIFTTFEFTLLFFRYILCFGCFPLRFQPGIGLNRRHFEEKRFSRRPHKKAHKKTTHKTTQKSPQKTTQKSQTKNSTQKSQTKKATQKSQTKQRNIEK